MAEVLEGVVVGPDGFERRVAIKRILPDYASNPAFLRMFMDEARIASRLHHAGIVAVLDYGLLDGRPFQVLELVEGKDLSSLLKTPGAPPLPAPAALHIASEIARALHYAHTAEDEQGRRLGVVHRDVSPSNVLLAYHGDVKLTDFGIALAHDRSERTETGVAKGKRTYMAPEQLLGGSVDGRADIFSLGCLLHWLFTGQSPLARPEAVETLLRHDYLEFDPSLPADVAEIVRRATRSRAVERYRDAAAMARALSEAAASRSTAGAAYDLTSWLDALPRDTPGVADPSEGATEESSMSGIEVVLDEDFEGGLRTFHAVGRSRPSDKPTAVERPAPTARSHPRRRRLAAAAGLATVAVAFAVGIGVVERSSSTAPPVEADAPDASRVGAFGPAVRGEGPPADPSSGHTPSDPVAEPARDAEPPPPERTAEARSDSTRERPRRPSRPPTAPEPGPAGPPGPPSGPQTPAAPDPEPSEASEADGYLWVGGARSVNLEIYVDGVRLGRAPRRLRLSPGPHRVELRDGAEVVASNEVTVSEEHTGRRPLRWLLND